MDAANAACPLDKDGEIGGKIEWKDGAALESRLPTCSCSKLVGFNWTKLTLWWMTTWTVCWQIKMPTNR